MPAAAWLIVLAFILFAIKSSLGCGCGYVSSCATTLKMEVDGVESQFQVSACSYLTVFNNHNFGPVNSLSVTHLKSTTWESCNYTVMNARLYYRIYEQGTNPGAFTILDLAGLAFTTSGSYTTCTYEESPGLNLLPGLNPGSYFIEIYFESDVDFSNNGTPNAVLTKNNGGSNYIASFTVPTNPGGSLNVQLTSKTNVSCNGGNDGSATVSVTNGTPPVTYLWSNGATTATISNLPAGTYTVTATDGGSNSGTHTVIITHPALLVANASGTDETSASANDGSASSNPYGGTTPYLYLWSNGGTTATISGLNSGIYTVTVTDNKGCTATGSVLISVSGNAPTYCSSLGNFPWVDWITGVNINTLGNTSDKTQYSDFTGMSTDLNHGTAYTLNLNNGFSWQTYDEYWRVWIDFNGDGTFDEPGEIAWSGMLPAPPTGTPGGTMMGSITVPTTAVEGLTRMRVALKRGAYAGPCETIPFGEVEDYTVNLVNGVPPPCSISIATANELCNDNGTPIDPADDTFTFDLTVNGNGTGATWTASIDGQSFSGSYGVLVNIGPFDISAGVLNFTVQDANDPGCNSAGSVTPPATCSYNNPCSISATTSNLNCNDNGTPSDPADDTFTFNLTVTGSNTGSNWTATVLGLPVSGSYGTPITMGPYAINGGNIVFTVQDANDPACTAAVSVTPPAPCSNGGGGASYCNATSNFPWHDWIAGVNVADLNNPSGKSPNTDFTGLAANVTAGESFPVALTAGYSWFTYAEHWKVWIDYNQDGIFSEPGELAFSVTQAAPPNGTLEATVNGTLDITATALPGTTRMRVAMKRNADPSPCETLPFGEVEDYTVVIAANAGNATGDRALALQLDAVPNLDVIDLYAVVEIAPDATTWRLEKSADGLYFEELQTGTLDPLDEFIILEETDPHPFEGQNFFRLSMLDISGKVLSKTFATANYQLVAAFELFPNPATTEFFVEMSKFNGKQVRVEVFNELGHSVFHEILPETNETLHLIPTAGWLDGMYFVVIRPEGRRAVTKRVMVGRL
jgi:GEVED domain/SprB repeat/Secretion system C-terminal sorting domain